MREYKQLIEAAYDNFIYHWSYKNNGTTTKFLDYSIIAQILPPISGGSEYVRADVRIYVILPSDRKIIMNKGLGVGRTKDEAFRLCHAQILHDLLLNGVDKIYMDEISNIREGKKREIVTSSEAIDKTFPLTPEEAFNE